MPTSSAARPLFDPLRVPAGCLLAAGAFLWALSVGGRWDVALAAWGAPVLLLRFVRSTRPIAGAGLIWLLSIAAALWWMYQLAVPVTPVTLAACVAFGTIQWLPYLLDRIAGERLGAGARLILFPASMVASEFALGAFSPLGTAYGLKAVTQYANLPLLQVIAITGPYGIGFLIGWFATTANYVWERQGFAEGQGFAKGERCAVGAYAAMLALVLVGGSLRLAWSYPATGYVRVAGIVPSRAILLRSNAMLGYDLQGGARPPAATELARTDPARQQPAFALVQDELVANTRQAARAGAKLVVWSENAAVTRAADMPALLARLGTVAREQHIYLDAAVNVPFVRDETHLFGPDGRELWTYRKARPIPGLEVYAPGDGRVPVVDTPFGRIANVICYDADFPALLKGVDADILLVPGGDWPEMGRVHTLRMARLRAIENGFALFRQDYNGLSAAFDRQGDVLGVQDTTLSDGNAFFVDVPTKGNATVYRTVGDAFAVLCVMVMLALLALGSRARFQRSSPPSARRRKQPA